MVGENKKRDYNNFVNSCSNGVDKRFHDSNFITAVFACRLTRQGTVQVKKIVPKGTKLELFFDKHLYELERLARQDFRKKIRDEETEAVPRLRSLPPRDLPARRLYCACNTISNSVSTNMRALDGQSAGADVTDHLTPVPITSIEVNPGVMALDQSAGADVTDHPAPVPITLNSRPGLLITAGETVSPPSTHAPSVPRPATRPSSPRHPLQPAKKRKTDIDPGPWNALLRPSEQAIVYRWGGGKGELEANPGGTDLFPDSPRRLLHPAIDYEAIEAIDEWVKNGDFFHRLEDYQPHQHRG